MGVEEIKAVSISFILESAPSGNARDCGIPRLAARNLGSFGQPKGIHFQ
jgi:hypothetical protein